MFEDMDRDGDNDDKDEWMGKANDHRQSAPSQPKDENLGKMTPSTDYSLLYFFTFLHCANVSSNAQH